MVRKEKMAALCSLVFFVLLTACRGKSGEFTVIGETGGELCGGREGTSESASAGREIEDAWGWSEAGAEESEAEPIYVYVCGAVSQPGVVKLPSGSRAEDALKAAGGFAEDADRDFVNLAARVSDGEKLYFPVIGEETVSAEKQDGRVNINTADAAQLMTLPGIGEAKAADIISYRAEHGAFESCEDIMKVSGIKTSVYNKIKEHIRVK